MASSSKGREVIMIDSDNEDNCPSGFAAEHFAWELNLKNEKLQHENAVLTDAVSLLSTELNWHRQQRQMLLDQVPIDYIFKCLFAIYYLFKHLAGQFTNFSNNWNRLKIGT